MSKILIIEDNQEIRENLEEILELSDYEVISAENGKRGMKLILKEIPDLILCDISMPEMNGYQVLDRLRSDPSIEVIPFIFLTSSAQEKDKVKGMKAGADAYLPKPFPIQDLMDSVEFLLNKKRITRP